MTATAPQFWRDPQLPFVEARAIEDGRKVCYALHSHEIFSIGAITGGTSIYINGNQQLQVSTGDVVMINPQQAHACNPIGEQRWSYIMFYIDATWLGKLQQEIAGGDGGFIPFAQVISHAPDLFNGLNRLYALLIDPQHCQLEKQIALVEYFTELQICQGDVRLSTAEAEHPRLEAAASFISQHCTQPLTLEAICQAAALSPSYLIRAFKRRYGMTPHAYLVNQRIQFGHRLLKRGYPIAAAASESGFADQAHFQRTFKLLLAATPGQYQNPR